VLVERGEPREDGVPQCALAEGRGEDTLGKHGHGVLEEAGQLGLDGGADQVGGLQGDLDELRRHGLQASRNPP
jgi:hypothetical protein